MLRGSGRLFGTHGKGEEKSRALAHRRFHPDFSSMHLDDALRDGKPQAGAALLLCDRIVGLLEFLEKLGLIGGGNARTGIMHRHTERAVGDSSLYQHLAAIGE